MPRYEKQAQKGTAFIDIRIAGSTVTTIRGRPGKPPETRSTTYASTSAAGDQFAAALALARSRKFVRARTIRARNAELEQAIEADLDDDEPRIVYGDWLLERGDPRGELVAIQAKLAKGPVKPAVQLREQELLADHSNELYGPFDEILHDRRSVRIDWRLGFFDEIELCLPDEALHPHVQLLVALPSARFLRRLVLGTATRYDKALQAVARLPPTLRSLTIASQHSYAYDLQPQTLGRLDVICSRHPKLQKLALVVDRDPLAGLGGLLALEQLDIWTHELGWRQLEAIGSASWPALTTLGLAIGSRAAATAHDVAALLDAARFPKLAQLRLGRLSLEAAAELGAWLDASPLGRQLTCVTLVDCEDDVIAAFRAVTNIAMTAQPRDL
jgi:uncharacterized protein (TIGR02996 family)